MNSEEDKGIGLKGWIAGPKPKRSHLEQVPDTVWDKRRLAVLPLLNMISDPADEYFADGMTEEMISTLSKIQGLQVISRTSIMQYKEARKNAREIGQDLKVGSALEGSVRKAGSKLRIAVQLIDTQTDANLWSESYDKDLADVFAIQTDIASRVAKALKIRLLPTDRERIEKVPTENLEAYDLYLKGRFYQIQGAGNPSMLHKAIDSYSQAIKRDSKYARAFAGLADTYGDLLLIGQFPLGLGRSKAREFATRALELDDSIPETHLALAKVLRRDWEWKEAEREIKKAIQLEPNLAQAHSYYSIHLLYMSRFDEAVVEIMRALELDPLSAETSERAGIIYLYMRDYEKAAKHLRRVLEIDPNIVRARGNLGLVQVCSGSLEEGIAAIEKAVELSEGKNTLAKVDLAYAYAKAGRLELARRILEELLKSSDQGGDVMRNIAGVYSIIGESNKAFEWLEKAYDQHSLLGSISFDYAFENIRSDPRFETLLKKMGLAQ